MKKSIFNWSGGKDSAMALYKVLQDKEYNIESMVTTINSDKGRVSMHGLRESVLDLQVSSIGLPVQKVMLSEMPEMDEYNSKMKSMLKKYASQRIEYSIFGDIFLEDLKSYRDQKLAEVGMKGVYPLWKMKTMDLMKQFIEQGFRSVIICTDAKYLDESFLGREIDREFINDLPYDIDPCGENGEYHSFVYDGPFFKYPIEFVKGEKVFKEYKKGSDSSAHNSGFWYLDLLTK